MENSNDVLYLKWKAIFISTLSVWVSICFSAHGRNCLAEVNFAFGPFNNNGPGSVLAPRVCFMSSNGCMMLDFPELLAPARIVSGRTSIRLSWERDLNP